MESQQGRVLVQLRDLILRGTFAPGERLAEIPLAERLRASRTPVRTALVTLEQEGLVETSASGGYVMRRFTPREMADAIAVRATLEGMAARMVAEHGVSRQLSNDLRDCLAEGDRVLETRELDEAGYAGYAAMNDRLHALVVGASGNDALVRAIEVISKLPFGAASAMLPLQGAEPASLELLRFAHWQHHMLVDALHAGQSARAQALAIEHTEVAQTNLRRALESPDESARRLPAMRLVRQAL